MALTQYEQVASATKKMESAIYEALDAIDSYRDLIASLKEAEESAAETNQELVSRYASFVKKAESMSTTIEDGVLDDLLVCLHRLFAVELTERGEFI